MPAGDHVVDRIIAHAALNATDRIMDAIDSRGRHNERAALWSKVFEEVRAAIEAAIIACEECQQEQRLKPPGRN